MLTTIPPVPQKKLNAFLGSAAVALVSSLVIGALQIAGVISLGLAHFLMLLAWIVGVIFIWLVESDEYTGRFRFVSIVVFSIVLIGVDCWMIKKGAELDRLETEKPPINKKAQFLTLIPLGVEGDGSLIVPTSATPEDPKVHLYADLNVYSKFVPEQKRRHLTQDERYVFVRRLLQFSLLLFIRNLQTRGGGFRWKEGKVESLPLELVSPPQESLYAFVELKKAFAGNDFFIGSTEVTEENPMTVWDMGLLRLPIGAIVSFPESPSSNSYALRIERPGYFVMNFTVGPLLMEIGGVPKGYVAQEPVQDVKTYQLTVEMNYQVQRDKGADFPFEDYVKWMDGLFDGLKKKLGQE